MFFMRPNGGAGLLSESRQPGLLQGSPCSFYSREESRSPVGRLVFKTGWGCQAVPGGFDSHTLPPEFLRITIADFTDAA